MRVVAPQWVCIKLVATTKNQIVTETSYAWGHCELVWHWSNWHGTMKRLSVVVSKLNKRAPHNYQHHNAPARDSNHETLNTVHQQRSRRRCAVSVLYNSASEGAHNTQQCACTKSYSGVNYATAPPLSLCEPVSLSTLSIAAAIVVMD